MKLTDKYKTLRSKQYTTGELASMTGRHKSRIAAIARQEGIGTLETLGDLEVRLFTRAEVRQLLKWLDENGKAVSQEAKSIRDA